MAKQIDILVVGGGMAGICAALGAAESGKEVILLEQSSFIGGNATKSNVGTICGAFYRSLSGNIIPAGNSFAKRFIKDLMKAHEVEQPVNHHNGLYIVPYEWSALLQFLERKIAERDNISVLCNVQAVGAMVCGKKIENINARVNGVDATFTPASVVDCSGKSVISQLAGLDSISANHYQAATQVFRLSGVTSTSEFSLNMAIKKAMATLIGQKKWPESFKVMSVVPGSLRRNMVDIKLTMPEVITDDAFETGSLNTKSIEYVRQVFPALKEEVESLQNAAVEMVFPEPGIRVLKRSKGVYTLTEEDVVRCLKDRHGVAAGVWPIEYWENNGNVEMVYFDQEDGYLIPAECLQSDQVDNLFFAGKNISATDRAIASARVMGTCIQTGYAAGKLAACAGKKETKEMVNQLHRELKVTDREYI